MKYQDISAFQKHLKGSAPKDFSHCYYIAMKDPFELESFLERMKKFFLHYHCDVETVEVKLHADPFPLLNAIEEISLFSPKKLILVSGGESLTKEGWKKIESLLTKALEGVTIFFGSDKGISVERKFIEKIGVVLDLTEEKPWDKKKRVQGALVEKIQAQGKRISPVTLEALFTKVGVESAALESEIDKLLCYIGDRKEIALQDIEALVTPSIEQKGFLIASALVWQENEEILDLAIIEDTSQLLALLGTVRYHIYIGLKICQNLNDQEKIAVDNIRPKQLEFYATRCKELGTDYFENALIQTFSIEMQAKNSSLLPSFLWDLLRIHIYGTLSNT